MKIKALLLQQIQDFQQMLMFKLHLKIRLMVQPPVIQILSFINQMAYYILTMKVH